MSSHLKKPISDNVGKKSITKQQPETAHVALPALRFKRALGARDSLSHTEIMQLQRTIGNRRVCRLLSNTPPIQPKLTVGPVIDKYEQEVDKVAENVFKQSNAPSPQPAQRREPEEEELLQGRFETAQRQAAEDEDLLQARFAGSEPPTQRQDGEDRGENRTGMPNPLKVGLEQLSGLDLSDVRVHRNSAKPTQLNALAYTQGQDIHVGPGQERSLPHEGWHAVQQAQGQVKPTMQAKGVSINDNEGLEHEADVMGARASEYTSQLQGAQEEKELMQGKFAPGLRKGPAKGELQSEKSPPAPTLSEPANDSGPLQRAVGPCFGALPVIQREFEDADKVDEDAVGFLRGPAQGPETGSWEAEGKNEFGEIDGGISSNVAPHAFTDGGRTGESTWHHCGGGGGMGNEECGSADLVAPVYKSKPAKPGGQAKAWIKKGTGIVKVKRSFMGVTHGAQGAYTSTPPGTVWMSPRAKDRVDKHEREHIKKTKEIHKTYIKPLEQRIAKYRGFIHAKKAGTDEAAAIAALKTEIDWNSAVESFASEDTRENTPMGPVDEIDMQKADFYNDYPTKDEFQQKSNCDTYEGVGASKRGKT